MSTLSLGARGKILGFTRYTEAVGWLIQLFEYVENWADGGVGTTNLTDQAVTTAKLADNAGTLAKVSAAALSMSGTYTGDGTADRVIAIPFRPKFVWIIRGDTSMVFEAVDYATNGIAGRRTSAGVWTGSVPSDTDWQGIVATGFKLGHAAGGGLSNAAGQVYTYYAAR